MHRTVIALATVLIFLHAPVLAAPDPAGPIALGEDGRLTGTLRDAPLPDALFALAGFEHLSLVASAGALDPARRLTLRLDGLRPAEALEAVCAWAGLALRVQGRVVLVEDRPAAPAAAAPSDLPLATLAPELERALLEAPALVAAQVARDPRLVWAHELPETPDRPVHASAVYAAGRVTITVRRRDAAGPLAVLVAPGSYGERRGEGDNVQDLALLAAPVLVLAAGEREGSRAIPVACATFEVASPEDGQRFSLRCWRRGTALERLLRALCARQPADELGDAAGQLALWIVRDRIGAARLTERPVRTFAGAPVTAAEGEGAAEVVRRAGLDPAAFPFFAPSAR